MSETAIIVLNYNGGAYLATCMRTLLMSSYTDFKVILVDNASSDGSLETIEKKYSKLIKNKKIRIIRNSINTGFAEGNNIGFRAVTNGTKFVVLLNNDVIIPRNWLQELVTMMRKYTDTSIGGSLIINKTKDVNPKKELANIEWAVVNLNMEHGSKAKHKNHLDDAFEHFYVSGNGMIIRKAKFATLFNKDYFAYAEDIDVAWNAKLRGERVLLSKKAYLLHHNSATKKANRKLSEIAIFNGTKNQIVNYLTHYEWKNVLRIFPLFALTQLGHIVYKPRNFIYKLKAYFWTITNLPRIVKYRRRIQNTRKVPDNQLIRELSGVLITPSMFSGWRQNVVKLVNICCLGYCWIVRLKTTEFSPEFSNTSV